MPSLPLQADLTNLGRVCRLGLATRGGGKLDWASVIAAIDRGVNYLNWCGQPDGMRDAIRRLGPHRREVVIAVQLEARRAGGARQELDALVKEQRTDYIDVATYYYVERENEWRQIAAGGAAEAFEEVRRQGKVRSIGLTSHQRKLAARIADSGRLDLLMVRYNATHQGAQQDLFPTAAECELPVVAFTCLGRGSSAAVSCGGRSRNRAIAW
jgi:aryl-alcohol dehydrogenase-like predicted oxidoreductase